MKPVLTPQALAAWRLPEQVGPRRPGCEFDGFQVCNLADAFEIGYVTALRKYECKLLRSATVLPNREPSQTSTSNNRFDWDSGRLMKLFGRRDLPPVLVASMGRSGSTVCYNAIAQGMARERFGCFSSLKKRATRSPAWDVANCRFKPGIVYKTHALAGELPASFTGKVFFTFGQASDAALSVVACRQKYGAEWVAEHFEHLRANGGFSELGERDVLRFEEQIDGWLNLQGHDIMAIRYDALWDHLDELAEFLGFPVRLPPKKARQSLELVDDAIVAGFRKTYARLDAKIAALPNRIIRRVS